MHTTIDAPVQEARAERTPTLNRVPTTPIGIDPKRFPILARHWPDPPERAHRPALRLISDRSLPPIDDVVDEAIEHLAWDAYIAAIDAHDHHGTAATQRCHDATFRAWQQVFLEEHEEARP